MNCIDIVIPCAGRAADLLRLLASLHQACAASLSLHVASITVTDDRPSPDLAARVHSRFPAVNYVHGPARGPAVNRNHGASLGRAAWLLFLDDDGYVQIDLLGNYARAVLAGGAADGTTDGATDGATDVFEGAIHAVGPRPNGNHHAPLNTTGGCLWSCNVLVRRAVFEAVGRFDEDFPFACMEDCDLRERLRARGARIVFVEQAVVLHPWRSISERELTRQIISHAIYASKHPAFVRDWSLLHVLRMLRGRLQLYRSHRSEPVPWAKYRTVGYDLVTPFVLYAVIRLAPLRRALRARHINRPALPA